MVGYNLGECAMVKGLANEFDWYKSKNLTIKQRGTAALASVYVRPVKVNAFSSTRYVWPSNLENDTRYMTRRVVGRVVPNA